MKTLQEIIRENPSIQNKLRRDLTFQYGIVKYHEMLKMDAQLLGALIYIYVDGGAFSDVIVSVIAHGEDSGVLDQIDDMRRNLGEAVDAVDNARGITKNAEINQRLKAAEDILLGVSSEVEALRTGEELSVVSDTGWIEDTPQSRKQRGFRTFYREVEYNRKLSFQEQKIKDSEMQANNPGNTYVFASTPDCKEYTYSTELDSSD